MAAPLCRAVSVPPEGGAAHARLPGGLGLIAFALPPRLRHRLAGDLVGRLDLGGPLLRGESSVKQPALTVSQPQTQTIPEQKPQP